MPLYFFLWSDEPQEINKLEDPWVKNAVLLVYISSLKGATLSYLLTKGFLATAGVFLPGPTTKCPGVWTTLLRFSFSEAGNLSSWQGDAARCTSVALHLMHFWSTPCQVDVHLFDLGNDFQAEIETLGSRLYLINTFHLRVHKTHYKYFSTQPNSSARWKAGGRVCTDTVFMLQKIVCLVR